MRKIVLTIVFTDEGGTSRTDSRTVSTTYEPDAGGNIGSLTFLRPN